MATLALDTFGLVFVFGYQLMQDLSFVATSCVAFSLDGLFMSSGSGMMEGGSIHV